MSKSATNTVVVTGTGVVLKDAARLFGIVPLAGTSPTCRLFDNESSASGTEVYPAAVLTVGTPVNFPPGGIPLANGLHATIGGTGGPSFLLIFGSP